MYLDKGRAIRQKGAWVNDQLEQSLSQKANSSVLTCGGRTNFQLSGH